MLEDFGCTQEELAGRIKRSRPQISNTIRLLRLPPTVQRRVAAGVLSAGHARALLALPDHASQERLAQRVVAEGCRSGPPRRSSPSGARGKEPSATRRVAPPPRRANLILEPPRSPRSDWPTDWTPGSRSTAARPKGRLTIEFASAEDLERIARLIEQT